MAYNAFLHPLRHFPGPLLHRTTYWPWAYRMARGQLAWHVADLHKNYGTIVRITPNELALLEPEAWKDIYGLQPGGTYLEKYMPTYRPAGRLAPSIISAAKDEHSVLRKLMAPAFSEKSMREQEPVIGHYVDLLIERLRERAGCGESALNIRDWCKFVSGMKNAYVLKSGR